MQKNVTVVIVPDTTDHFSQMCILTSQCKTFFPNNKTKVRDCSTFATKSVIDVFQNINWNTEYLQTYRGQSIVLLVLQMHQLDN